MRRTHLAALTGLALILAACDQVRLPGLNPVEPELSAEPKGSAAGDAVGGYTEADLQPTPEEIEAERAETTRIAAETAVAAPAPAAPLETPAAGATAMPEDESAPAPAADTAALPPDAALATSLGIVNASRCILPSGAPATPTVAKAAGATELEEPVMGTEAVNALAASLSAFPGIVKIEPRRAEPTGVVASGHCGAVRVARNWFVTAAHCIDEPFDEIRVIGEAANLRSPEAKRASADYAVCHAGYQGTDNGYANDIALVRLSEEQVAGFANVPVARFGATAQALAPANYPVAEMAGWGLTRFDGELSNELLTTRLKILSAGPAAITVTSENGAGPCIGDSGGPLYVTEADGSKTVVGILSVVEQNRTTGHFCEGEYNGRYINLQGYAGWMTSVMALCEDEGAACR
ncbi:trypsin domain protein [Hyphomonas neptunium ATCC 15444]|uniref:Trypsin domain protein n=2 Tax=Hyphomonas TaxID=85 RepID=Q0C4L4_HYPNA|nr:MULTISPECIES: trypsin-like serine protease [Hyphomonas]ABI75361.1 trypsin domain protein [Hyphomonas neptunium ATCC 15444]KCZ96460.1 trypsin domain-containing protein [Hyphomonas hirschiana VP5]